MKILITYATAGAGHKQAARALYQAVSASSGDEVVLLDALDMTSALFKKFYSRSYEFIVSHLSWLWRISFWMLDQPWMQFAMAAGRRMYNRIYAGRLHRYLISEQFDCIITTHFMPIEIASALKQQGKIQSRLIAVVTDYDVHHIWLGSGVDCYAVATDWTRDKLTSLGVSPEKVAVTGIPTVRKFSVPKERKALCGRLDIRPDIFTVLIATGSFGMGPIEEVVDSLEGIQMLVICGHNQNLYQRLSQKDEPLLRPYGFVHNMDELMGAADMMITKPGGLSISEALVSGLPLIFFSAIPGQEEHNVKVLAQYGVGIKGPSVSKIAETLHHFRDHPSELAEAKERAGQLARPGAARDILALVV
ncbi:MAG: MGDG synthase family glycosyltransferase [Candidatus Omnitrophota bacterium]